MPTMTTQKCASCKHEFQARTADVKRGWGKFCSKSCKAIKQEARTGQYNAYLSRSAEYEDQSGVVEQFQRPDPITGAWLDGK